MKEKIKKVAVWLLIFSMCVGFARVSEQDIYASSTSYDSAWFDYADITYDDGTAVITIYVKYIDTYDVGIVSNATCITAEEPMSLFLTVMGYDSNLACVSNPSAVDSYGNKYAVTTGAGRLDADGSAIPYEGPIAQFTYENVKEGTEFIVVTHTTPHDNVCEAPQVARLIAKESTDSRKEGYAYIDKVDCADINIHKSGYGYAYFTLADYKGTPYKNVKVDYEIDGASYNAVTDENGLITIKLPYMQEDMVYDIEFSADIDEPLKGTAQQVEVDVTDLSFSQTWSGGISLSGGGSLGIFSTGAGVGGQASISYAVADNKKTLSFNESVKGSFSGSGSTSLDVLIKNALGSTGTMSLKTATNAKKESSLSGGLYIDNYNSEDPVQALQIASTVLYMNKGGSVWMEKLAEKLFDLDGYYMNVFGTDETISIGSSGSISLKDSSDKSINLLGIGGGVDYTTSIKLNEAKSTIEKSMKQKTNSKLDLLSFKKISTSLLSSKSTNSVDAKVAMEVGGKSTISSTVVDGMETSVLIGQVATSEKHSLKLDEDSSNDILSINNAISDFGNKAVSMIGTNDFNLMLNKIWSDQTSGVIKHSNEETTGISVGIPILKYPQKKSVLNVNMQITGSETVSYTDDTYLWKNGKRYILSDSDVTRDDVISCKISVFDIISKAFDTSADYIVSLLGFAKGGAGKSVTSGNTYVAENGANYFVGLTSLQPQNTFKVQYFMAANSGIADIEKTNVSVAETISDPCYIQVYSPEDEEIVVSDDELSKNPITVTMTYEESALQELGIDESYPINIYWYDDVNQVYVCQPNGVKDTDANTITVEANHNGEYIIGTDSAAPLVYDLNVSNGTTDSVLTGYATDLSGIGKFDIYLDGKKIVKTEEFIQMYDETTGAFSVELMNLTEGEHLISIETEDTLGNKPTESYTHSFTVDTDTPQIVSANMYINEDGTAFVESEINGESLDMVYVEITDAEGYAHYQDLTNTSDNLWTCDLDAGLYSDGMIVKVVTIDEVGNKSEQAVELIQDNFVGYVLGDVDANDSINATDALAVLKHAAKISTLTDNQLLAADTSKDGNINATDALQILKYAAKIIDNFDVM